MNSSDKTTNSIRNALFDAAVQLSVPVVLSTATAADKVRAYSSTDQSIPSSSRSQSPSHKCRYSLSSNLSRSFRKSEIKKGKILRDVATQSSLIDDSISSRPRELNLILDDNNNPTTSSSISETSKEYLSVPRHSTCSTSPSHSPTRNGKSLKNTLKDIWYGLNSDEIRSASSSPIDQKHFEDRIKLSYPNWKAFTKVVTSLLTFTRTKKDKYQWIQLVGHPGTFKEGFHDGFVLKQFSEDEQRCCESLQNDALRDFAPRYNGTVKDEEGKFYIEMQDLLSTFQDPCIMDCKIGVRTYLEEDLEKSERDPKPRADLYEKMVSIDPNAPTEQENEEKKLLKPRYMMWRESLSSSQELGFRIEAIKKTSGLMSKEFQRIKERNDVRKQLADFIGNSLTRANQYLRRLIELRSTCLHSKFFRTHELIGSSLLFVHDSNQASLWMIDFGKTRSIPPSIEITHDKPWIRGSHEDGYLIGLDNLILLFQEIIDELKLTLVSN